MSNPTYCFLFPPRGSFVIVNKKFLEKMCQECCLAHLELKYNILRKCRYGCVRACVRVCARVCVCVCVFFSGGWEKCIYVYEMLCKTWPFLAIPTITPCWCSIAAPPPNCNFTIPCRPLLDGFLFFLLLALWSLICPPPRWRDQSEHLILSVKRVSISQCLRELRGLPIKP